jgi:hypothetical protein
MIGTVLANIFKAICFTLALAWLAVIVVAQQVCSIVPSIGHQCNGPQLDVWMGPYLAGVIGLPATIASIIILVAGEFGISEVQPA